MASSLTLNQVTSVVTGPSYRLVNTITSATDIDSNVFVLAAADDSFNHCAYVADLEMYPADKAEAVAAGLGYYRADTVTIDKDTVEDAVAQKADIVTRLNILVSAWDDYVADFADDVTVTIPEV